MHLICSWCGSIQEMIDDEPHQSPVSHGICPECQAKIRMRPAVEATSFLNRFATPIYLVDNDGRIVTANNAAQKVHAKDLDQISGELGGDVMECIYAKNKGGCGNTVHCKGCTIRNNVNHTMETKQNLYRVSATLNTIVKGANTTIQYLISTEWTEEGVLLKIEETNGEIPFRHNERV